MNALDLTYLPKQNQILVNKQQELTSTLENLEIVEGSDRPNNMTINGFGGYGGEGYNYYSGYGSIGQHDLYWMWRLSDVCVTIGHTLKRKVFKNGFDLTPKIDNASEQQEAKIKRFNMGANTDGQHFDDVLKEIEDDLNSIDKGCLLLIKDYLLNKNGDIVGSELREVSRLNPIHFFEMRDKQFKLGFCDYQAQDGNVKSKRAYVTLADRNNLVYEKYDKITGRQNIEIHYRYVSAEGSVYYNRNEIIYKNKFKRHGFSPLYALNNKIMTLIEMDYYVRQEYSEGKPSKKMLAFKTSNRDAMVAAFQDYDKKVKKNPNRLHPLIVTSEPDNRQPLAEVIDFMKPLNEMGFNEMRARYITDIGAPYGVSAMFMNDMSTGGGLNNEGLQITVTNEAVEGDKDLFNRYYIAPVMLELGITDWDVKLFPSEEEDQVWKQDLFSKQLKNAKDYLDLGGEVGFKDNEFMFEEKDVLVKSEVKDDFNPFGNVSKNDTSYLPVKKKNPTIPEELALEITMKEYQEEFTKLVTQTVNKI
jgi:hypothetical protein